MIGQWYAKLGKASCDGLAVNVIRRSPNQRNLIGGREEQEEKKRG
jgi:hypothetical protein